MIHDHAAFRLRLRQSVSSSSCCIDLNVLHLDVILHQVLIACVMLMMKLILMQVMMMIMQQRLVCIYCSRRHCIIVVVITLLAIIISVEMLLCTAIQLITGAHNWCPLVFIELMVSHKEELLIGRFVSLFLSYNVVLIGASASSLRVRTDIGCV